MRFKVLIRQTVFSEMVIDESELASHQPLVHEVLDRAVKLFNHNPGEYTKKQYGIKEFSRGPAEAVGMETIWK